MSAEPCGDEETGILLGTRLLGRPSGYVVKDQLTGEEKEVYFDSRLPHKADKPAKAEIRPSAEANAA
jgi:hypothetical protein